MSSKALTIIKATQSLIKAGDIEGAERALATVAETEGDHALVAVLEDLPAKDLLAIIREYDASKESLVNLVVTPELFAQAVVLEKRYADLTHEQLRGMINAVIFREGADTAEFLYEIAEVEGGYDALADYLQDRTQMVEHYLKYGTFDLYEYGEDRTEAQEDDLMGLGFDDRSKSSVDMAAAEDHDWMQVTSILRNELPEIFREVIMKLRKRYQIYLKNKEKDELEALLSGDDTKEVSLTSVNDERKKAESPSDDEEESAL